MLDTFSAPSCRPPEEGYGTAALRKAGSQLAGYFPATPMVVRTPGVTPVSSGEITARTPGE